MTMEERRTLTFQLAAQLPEDRADAAAVVDMLWRIVQLHWTEESTVVTLSVVETRRQ